MSDEKKDLSHFLNNPDALGDLSDADLDALANSQGAATEEAPPAEQPKGDTESAATPGDTEGVQQKTDEAQQPDGILAKDGKHVIPYSRLEAAEQRAKDLQRQIDDLNASKESGTPASEGAATQAEATEGFLTDTELDELENDLPALAKVIRAQQAQVKALAGKVETLQADRASEQKDREADAEREWNKTLEQNPKAAYLNATLAPEVGQRFINAAAALNDNWNSMTNEQRAEAIVKQYEAVHGEIKVASVNTPSPQTRAETPASKPNVPTSMGNIPGGSLPAVDEAAAMASKTGAELTADFMKMTPEQIEAQLARL